MAKPTVRRITTGQGTANELTIVRSVIDIPVETYDVFAERALKHGRSPEEAMASRLTKTASHADDCLYLTPEQKKRLDLACGHTVSSVDGALQHLENLAKIKVGDVTIQIEPR